MNKPSNQSNPNESHTWDRVKAALRRDWDQTRHDLGLKSGQDLHQDIGNTVGQITNREPLPTRHVANAGETWSDEAAVRYGFESAQSPKYREQGPWNAALEASLQSEWEGLRTGRAWSDVRLAVRYGWMRSQRTHDA